MNAIIIYWSGTGNTELMADLIQQGSGADKKPVGECTASDLTEYDLIILGSPATGVEEIDTTEMEPFINENSQYFKNKSIALFGSYSWGEGDWIKTWEDRMLDLGGNILVESLVVNEVPEGESIDDCMEFGKKLRQLAL
ncbi:MAG: flavodoxin domain-containing protein [Lachnospiraceae bacterium]